MKAHHVIKIESLHRHVCPTTIPFITRSFRTMICLTVKTKIEKILIIYSFLFARLYTLNYSFIQTTIIYITNPYLCNKSTQKLFTFLHPIVSNIFTFEVYRPYDYVMSSTFIHSSDKKSCFCRMKFEI